MTLRLGEKADDPMVSFAFNGKVLSGRRGEPLAAALLANGVHLVARSFKYHRPRGIVSCGVEEPNALLQIGEGARSTPNLPATQVRLYEGLVARSQNCYPSVNFDVRSLNQLLAPFIPAGFYYKTFMGLRGSSWMRFEKSIRKAAGFGIAPEGSDPDEYDQVHRHCDLLIVGAGPAGLAAALTAAASNARVLLVEQDALGGSLLAEPRDSSDTIDGKPLSAWLAQARATLAAASNVTILTRCSLFGRYRHNWFAAIETLREAGEMGGVRQRLWKIRAKNAIFATGAIERLMVFDNNDRPGVMLAGAVREYAIRHRVSAGRKVLFATNNDSAYRAALDCKAAGVGVVAIIDSRATCDSKWSSRCSSAGIEVLFGACVKGALGRARVTGCDVMSDQGLRRFACDVIAVSGGWTPTIHLHSQLQGALSFRDSDGVFVPLQEEGQPVSVGSCNGTFDRDQSILEATTAAAALVGIQSPARGSEVGSTPATLSERVQHVAMLHTPSKCFVDLQNDVTAKDVQIAVREGFEINEHLKRYCGIGMGTDQGKIGNLNALAIAAELRGMSPPEVGLTRYRQPFSPVGIGAMAGRHRAQLLHPYRRSRLHDWHERAGAQFEPAGQWSIVGAYPKRGESLHEAVEREASSFRATALVDSSAGARFEVGGADAVAILDGLYFTNLTDLAVGEVRQAVLLTENGTISDLNFIWRLGSERFLVTTGATRGERLGMLLQSAVQSARKRSAAFVTEVSDSWIQFELLGADVASTFEGAVRNGDIAAICIRVVAGVPWHSLLVEAHRCLPVWDRLVGNGAFAVGHGAVAALQIEARIPRIGFEIDGTVNPFDLGWDMVPDKKFIGRRSVLRDREAGLPRRHLVCLESSDSRLAGGGQVLASDRNVPIGYVTSCARGPLSGEQINLALVEDGRHRIGQTLDVATGNHRIEVRVKPAVFAVEAF